MSDIYSHGIVEATFPVGDDAGATFAAEGLDPVEYTGDDLRRFLLFDGVSPGFCSECGAEIDRIDPDAEGFDCGACAAKGTVTSVGRILCVV